MAENAVFTLYLLGKNSVYLVAQVLFNILKVPIITLFAENYTHYMQIYGFASIFGAFKLC